MFRNKNQSRSARSQSDETFRRNTVVVSRSQREVAERKQTVTQRQVDAKKRIARKRAKRRTLLVIAVVLLFGFLLRMRVAGVSAKTQDPSLKLDSVKTAAYEKAANEYLQSKVPLRQSWLINTKDLDRSLQAKFPEVKAVYTQATNPVGSSLLLRLDFRKPLFVWKGVDGSIRYIDASGVLFERNYYTAIREKSLPTVEDQGASSSSAGAVIATTGLTRAISDIYKQLPAQYGEQKVSVAKVVLPRSAREVQAYISGVPYFIKFSTDRSVEAQIGELGQLLTYLKQNTITPGQYIDLRVPHKAYYK